MPFEIHKVNGYYMIWKIHNNSYAKAKFNTWEAANRQKQNWERYARAQSRW